VFIPAPLLYGIGGGSGFIQSTQATATARYTLAQTKGFRVGAGKSAWSNIYMRDFRALFDRLVNRATQKKHTG
jgi:hypothetical protein